MTCNDCIHQAVCYRYSYGLPENYASKCGDYESSRRKVALDKQPKWYIHL